MSNRQKFDLLRQFDLPVGQYAIIGSGPMGIRNLKEIGDIDLIVTVELWDLLAKKYGVIDTGTVKKIEFPGVMIEAFCEDSLDILRNPEESAWLAAASHFARSSPSGFALLIVTHY